MKRRFLIFLVDASEILCCFIHWIPGIRCALCNWGFRLDQKHKLGVWGPHESPANRSDMSLDDV